MTERRDTYAYFWVQGFDCAPQEISRRLGLSPTEVQLKGEVITGNRARQVSSWNFYSPLPRGDEVLDAHVVALLNALEPCTDAIRAASQQYETGINCVGYYYSANPGFHFSRDTIQRLGALGLPVDFDLYSYCSTCDVEAQN